MIKVILVKKKSVNKLLIVIAITCVIFSCGIIKKNNKNEVVGIIDGVPIVFDSTNILNFSDTVILDSYNDYDTLNYKLYLFDIYIKENLKQLKIKINKKNSTIEGIYLRDSNKSPVEIYIDTNNVFKLKKY
jgi:hypothetical protein